ncbi:hypothetical protein O9G_001573 [Rozella allomycis CSF55]|uniref:Uncharacterized protein n=1 Tax=Rozella allomycis (strain CSF55) TaxID=988480 RepID=A0A075B4T1_ROZAC|nr:hypothetical protein O9G_001573 [Rozella allomycis CSF55]|eukprot:EPZ36589.1 hypothetical protein O9G_001573 [Rozella allomycis CSF55]
MEELCLVSSNNESSNLIAYNIRTGAILASFKGAFCEVHGFAHGKDKLYVAQANKALLLSYHTSKESIQSRSVCPEVLTTLTVDPSGSYLVGGSMSGKIYIWLISCGSLLKVVDAHYKKVNKIIFTNDASTIISCSEDSLIKIWDFQEFFIIERNQPSHTIVDHSLPVTDMAISIGTKSNSILFSCSLDQTCHIFDVLTGKRISTLYFSCGLTSIAVNSIGNKLFVGSIYGNIFGVNLSERETTDVSFDENLPYCFTFNCHKRPITCLDVSFDDTLLVSGSSDAKLIVWSIEGRHVTRTLDNIGELGENIQMPIYKRTLEHISSLRCPIEIEQSFDDEEDSDIEIIPKIDVDSAVREQLRQMEEKYSKLCQKHVKYQNAYDHLYQYFVDK